MTQCELACFLRRSSIGAIYGKLERILDQWGTYRKLIGTCSFRGITP